MMSHNMVMLAQRIAQGGGGGGGGTAFVTGQTLGSARNDFAGGVGLLITLGAASITISDLGRWVISGNSQTHVLRIRNSSGTDLGNVTVNTSGAGSGAYLYGTLGSPVVLSAFQTYYILSDETVGGDQWYDSLAITTTGVTASVSSGYYDGAVHSGTVNQSYVPMNFKYT